MDKDKWFLRGGRGSGKTFRLLCETYENKIAELQHKVDTLQGFLDRDVEFDNLQKENAELKGLVNQYKASKCGSISLVNRNMIMFDQLTKAKDLLKRCYENFIYLEPLRSEIEQFLNSEEK